jgi:hypothetical protein
MYYGLPCWRCNLDPLECFCGINDSQRYLIDTIDLIIGELDDLGLDPEWVLFVSSRA